MDDATNPAAGSLERRADAERTPAEQVTYWLNAIELAGNEEQEWRDDADKAVKTYRGESDPDFNILLANVETIAPSLYNSTPVPDVRSRFGDAGEVARQAGQLVERALSFSLDEYDFDCFMEGVVLDEEVTGRGVDRVRYRPYVRTDVGPDGQQVERVVWQEVYCEKVPWRQFRRGPAESWPKVPWVAFETYPTFDELVSLAGEDMAAKVPLDAVEPTGDGKTADRERTPYKRAKLWEIWDRETRSVIYIAASYKDAPLKVEPDPYRLLDFFPMPPPLIATADPDGIVPLVPYNAYRKQAIELDDITLRIRRLIRVLKYRGVRAAEVPEIDLVSEKDDGEFVPSLGALSVLGGGKSLDDAIWVAPIDKLVVVLRELLVQREQIKAVIFEITGVSDIIRGASNPNETLGAQQIKAQWSSLRLQKKQAAVQRHCRDIFRIKAELIAEKFTPQTLAMINGGQAIPEPVLAALRSDIRRTFLIDVETDSTVRGDLVRSQQNMANFLSGTAQFMQTFIPLLQSGSFPPQLAMAVVAIYSSFARQWKLGKQAEDALAQLEQAVKQQPLGEPDPQEKAEQEDAKQISRANAIANVQKTQAEAKNIEAKAGEAAAKTQAQQVETAAIASGAMTGGFVQ